MESKDLVLNQNQVIALRTFMDEFFRKKDDKKLRNMFRMFDRNGNGRVDLTELRTVMKQVSQERLSNEEIRQMMLEADTNKNGTIEYNEFCEIMLKLRRDQGFE
ncbi:hypothetical protein SteCoe_434 [Stentor coeruleus]|uniref:EF-hand domain-containing protein n=1 Tax=Stentor coeruleus TaxID=5963 RepID=A0A1R2D463_9CILI|nr:hypothetical protein SteCoe_434 [Stentor coeruleus]